MPHRCFITSASRSSCCRDRRRSGDVTARGGFMVDETVDRQDDVAVPAGAQLEAQVDVAEVDLQLLFVEAADLEIVLASHDQARAGHRRHLSRVSGQVHVGPIVDALADERVSRHLPRADDDAAVLDGAVRVEERRIPPRRLGRGRRRRRVPRASQALLPRCRC